MGESHCVLFVQKKIGNNTGAVSISDASAYQCAARGASLHGATQGTVLVDYVFYYRFSNHLYLVGLSHYNFIMFT